MYYAFTKISLPFHRVQSLADKEDRVRDALSPELYEAFTLCQRLPLSVLCEFENLTNVIACAMKERRINHARALKLQRSALGCDQSGMTAANMVIHLKNLKSQLDIRYDEHARAEDCDSGEICIEYQDRIQDILNTDSPSATPS